MVTKPKIYYGGCLCGAVRFEALGPVGKRHTCSCSICQAHAGALTMAWVEFPRERVTWTKGKPATYRSSGISRRAFCKRCGSSLGAIDDKPVVALLVAAFDNPKSRDLRPLNHFNVSGRPRWWRLEITE
jgi:hypothetical protein